MGQAKRRGTFEERQKAAIKRDKFKWRIEQVKHNKPAVGLVAALMSMLGESIRNNRR